MSNPDDHDLIKYNSNVVITNKVIAFWSKILQISNICDIGKYVEVRKYKIGSGIITISIIIGFVIHNYLSQDQNMINSLNLFPPEISSQYKASFEKRRELSTIISCAPFVMVAIFFILERSQKKKYYFRISMNGGQIHVISSDNEQFINKLMQFLQWRGVITQ